MNNKLKKKKEEKNHKERSFLLFLDPRSCNKFSEQVRSMLLEGLPLLVDIISLPDKLVPRSTTLTYEFSRLRSRLAKPLIFLPFFNNKRNHPPCFEFFTNILCNTSYVICEYQCYIQGVLNFNVKASRGRRGWIN